jgi:hypothetical protein
MIQITTPCGVCAVHAAYKGAPFFATRGLDWPTTEVAGHTVHLCCASEVRSLVDHVAANEMDVTDGIARWTTNGHVIPGDCAALIVAFGLAEIDVAATAAAREAETQAVLAAYREQRALHGYSEEEKFEMRGAFGPDADVVDVITGERVQL